MALSVPRTATSRTRLAVVMPYSTGFHWVAMSAVLADPLR